MIEVEGLIKNTVMSCASMYGFSAEEALKRIDLSGNIVTDKKQKKSKIANDEKKMRKVEEAALKKALKEQKTEEAALKKAEKEQKAEEAALKKALKEQKAEEAALKKAEKEAENVRKLVLRY